MLVEAVTKYRVVEVNTSYNVMTQAYLLLASICLLKP